MRRWAQGGQRIRVAAAGDVHAGRFEGSIGAVPVFNVALPMKREFWLFELSADRPRTPAYELIG